MTSGNKNSSLNDAKRAEQVKCVTQLSDIENGLRRCEELSTPPNTGSDFMSFAGSAGVSPDSE